LHYVGNVPIWKTLPRVKLSKQDMLIHILFVAFRTASLGFNSCRLQLEWAAGYHYESRTGDKVWHIWWDL